MWSGDGSASRGAVYEQWLFVSTRGKARTRLLDSFPTVGTSLRARAVSKVGWSGSAFALPEITIGDTPQDRVIFPQTDGAAHQYPSAGTLEEWQEHVGKLA